MWWVPEMGVPLNHLAIGYPISGNLHILYIYQYIYIYISIYICVLVDIYRLPYSHLWKISIDSHLRYGYRYPYKII